MTIGVVIYFEKYVTNFKLIHQNKWSFVFISFFYIKTVTSDSLMKVMTQREHTIVLFFTLLTCFFFFLFYDRVIYLQISFYFFIIIINDQ